MRLFLGYFPKSKYQQEFSRVSELIYPYATHFGFVKTSLIHMTLRFLGNDVSRYSYNKVIENLSTITDNNKAFNIRIEGVKFGFSGQRNPRILHIYVPRCEGLNKLVSDINEVIDSQNPDDVESYKYRHDPSFHFTLARTKKRLSRDIIKKVRKKIEKIEVVEAMRVVKFSLVKSVLGSEGPEYELLESYKL